MKKYCTASEFGDLDKMEMGGDTSNWKRRYLIYDVVGNDRCCFSLLFFRVVSGVVGV